MDATSMGTSDRFLGCILGHAIGDAAGAPFEGLPADVVFREFGSIHRLLADERIVETLYYTDDTEMTISVAEVLIEDGGFDVGRLAAAFGRNYNAGRGYVRRSSQLRKKQEKVARSPAPSRRSFAPFA